MPGISAFGYSWELSRVMERTEDIQYASEIKKPQPEGCGEVHHQ
jgi:hypothetical protein